MFVWNFLLILFLIVLNAFFVSVEFAAVAARKARIEILSEEGNSSARIVKSWLENPAARDRLIAASQSRRQESAFVWYSIPDPAR